MPELRGQLLFHGWLNRPWSIVVSDQPTDIFPIIDEVFKTVNGQQAMHESERESYSFSVAPDSNFGFGYEKDKTAWLNRSDDWGGSNVVAYLEGLLIWLSGRLVIFRWADESFDIKADPDEKVFTLQFTNGNSCRIPEKRWEDICKIGQGADCCIFLTVSGDGFLCEKFSGPTARHLLDRYYNADMNAGRIGNCAVKGREGAA